MTIKFRRRLHLQQLLDILIYILITGALVNFTRKFASALLVIAVITTLLIISSAHDQVIQNLTRETSLGAQLDTAVSAQIPTFNRIEQKKCNFQQQKRPTSLAQATAGCVSHHCCCCLWPNAAKKLSEN